MFGHLSSFRRRTSGCEEDLALEGGPILIRHAFCFDLQLLLTFILFYLALVTVSSHRSEGGVVLLLTLRKILALGVALR